MADRIQLRRDTKANWENYNPILLEGEPGHVLDDPNLYKMGDGIHTWNQLPYRGYNGTMTQDIQDSPNTVPSNSAVLKKISSIKSLSIGVVQRGYRIDGGNIVESSKYNALLTADVSNLVGHKLYVTCTNGMEYNIGLLIIDSNGNNIFSFPYTTDTIVQVNNAEIIVPQGAKTLYLRTYSKENLNLVPTCITGDVFKEQSNTNERFSDLEKDYCELKTLHGELIQHSYISLEGQLITLESSDPFYKKQKCRRFDVENLDYIEASFYSPLALDRFPYSFFDENMNLIYGSIETTRGQVLYDIPLNVPEGAKYLFLDEYAQGVAYIKTYSIPEKEEITIKANFIHSTYLNANYIGQIIRRGSSESSSERMAETNLLRVKPGIKRIKIKVLNLVDEYFLTLNQISEDNIFLSTVDINYNNFSETGEITVINNINEDVRFISLIVTKSYDSTENDFYIPEVYITTEFEEPIIYPMIRPLDEGYLHLSIFTRVLQKAASSFTPSNTINFVNQFGIDHGVLCLPESYSEYGEPTRLIMYNHGHGYTYGPDSVRFGALDIKPEFWLSEGYAIFDMDGSLSGTFSGNHDYGPMSMAAYESAYQNIVSTYNIRKDGVFAAGRSQGGGMQFTMCKQSTIPIIASCPLVPVVGPLGYLGRGDMTGAQIKQLLGAYGVPQSELDEITWSSNKWFHQKTSEEQQCIIDNQWRFNSYQPGFCFNKPITIEQASLYYNAIANRNVTLLDEYYSSVKDIVDISTYRHTPLLAFTCVGDPTIWYESVKGHIKLLADAGVDANIRVYPTTETQQNTDHRFEINPENLVTYTNSKGVEIQNVPKVYIEILNFWRFYEHLDSRD